ncbi:MAG: hypothetical protein WA708_14880 [Acidobacteriaceae bacterium]
MSKPGHKSSDLAYGGSAVLLWWLPVAALIVGANWPKLMLLLWIPALLVMGAACSVNAARCGRVHCYVTGPLFLLAALYAALSGFHVVPMQPNIFLGSILGVFLLARLAEFPLGKYRKSASEASQGSVHEC